jgi:hypothetical protein
MDIELRMGKTRKVGSENVRRVLVSLLASALAGALAGCAKNTTPIANPTPGSLAPTASVSSSLAVVPVQITYVLRSLRPALDSLFPAHDSLDRAACSAVAGLVCHQYVYRRDSLTLRSEGDRLAIGTSLAFRAQVGMAGVSRLASCGYQPETMRRATLAISTSLFWRRDWRIGVRGTTAIAELLDACRVTVLGVDATGTLRGVVNRQLADFATQADTAIPRVADLRPLADSLWRSFVEPTALDSTNTLWLTLEPEAVRVTPFIGNGPSIRTAIVLYAHPRVVSGAKPTVTSRKLPELSLGTAPDHFDVPVTVELPFGDLQRRAEAQLAVETAKSSVKVDSVHLRGAGDTLTVELQVSGAMRGTLTLNSRLRWDGPARELRLDELEWNLSSKGALSRVKATLGAPLVSRAIRRATMGGRIPLGAQLDSTRVELLRKLNGPVGKGSVLGGSVQDIQIISVRATATGIVVQARLTGQAGVWIQ